MVKGLELFKENFAPYDGQYVLIGGAACDLAMEEVGQSFRATQDLDIVLCAEALTDEFIGAFWQFVKDGGYSSREKSGGVRNSIGLRPLKQRGFLKRSNCFPENRIC